MKGWLAVAGEALVAGHVGRQRLAGGDGAVGEAGVGRAAGGPGGRLETALLAEVVAAAGRGQEVLARREAAHEAVAAAAHRLDGDAVDHRGALAHRRQARAAVASANLFVSL